MSDQQAPKESLPEAAAPTEAEPPVAGAAATSAETSGETSAETTAEALPGILPGHHWVELAENRGGEDDDADSAQGDDVSSTASLSSSILQYRTIQGRTYHSERGNAEYWVANDETANEALDIIHHVLTLSLDGSLFKAPLEENIQKVLDIGTGTGIWAIDFADAYPNASVIGTDVSPIQPGWVPPNLQFHMDDCTQDWTFEENSVDYVHIRWLFGSIKDWKALFEQAYRCLKPGGYLESHEPSVNFRSDDGTVTDESAMGQFGKFFVEGGKKMGRSMTVVEDGEQRKAIEAAGFVDIEEADLKTPIGSWPLDRKQNEIARFQQLAVEQDTEGTMLYLAGMLGWRKEEITVYIAHLRREFRSKNIHGHYQQKIVWGRKPLAS